MTERGAAVLILTAALERREAQGSSQEPARHGTPIPLKTLGSRKLGVQRRPIARPAKGASQAPWRLPALHPLVRGEKENRDAGHPGPEQQRTGAAERWLELP